MPFQPVSGGLGLFSDRQDLPQSLTAHIIIAHWPKTTLIDFRTGLSPFVNINIFDLKPWLIFEYFNRTYLLRVLNNIGFTVSSEPSFGNICSKLGQLMNIWYGLTYHIQPPIDLKKTGRQK